MGKFGDVLKVLIKGTPNVPTIPCSGGESCSGGTLGTANEPTDSTPGRTVIYPFIAINNNSFNRYNPVGVSFSIPGYGESGSCNVPDYIALDCPFDDKGIVPAGLKFVGVILHGNSGELAIIGRKV